MQDYTRMNIFTGEKQKINYFKLISFINTILLVIFIIVVIAFFVFMIKPGIFFNFVYKLDSTETLSDIPVYMEQNTKSLNAQDIIEQQDSLDLEQIGKSIDKIEVITITDNIHKQDVVKHLYKDFKFQSINAVLEIPSIKARGNIVSGSNERLMEKGFWHVNANGAWLQYGNVVIFGHRYYHLPPLKDTFYNLDKVKVGDSIMIYTDIGTWSYVVKQVRIVNKNDFSIFKNTKKPHLTLVTCHPLWTSKKRLVVVAELSSTLYLE